MTRNDITNWIGRDDLIHQQDARKFLMGAQKKWRRFEPEYMSLLADPAFLSWASFSEPPKVNIFNTPSNLDLKRIFWYQDDPKRSRNFLALVIPFTFDYNCLPPIDLVSSIL